MRNFVYQAQRHGCGFAAVKMLANRFSFSRRDYRFVPEPIVDAPVSLADVISYAESLGLTLRAYEAFSPQELAFETETPLLLCLQREGSAHMVVLDKIAKKRFRVFDPCRGPFWAPSSTLIREFTGVFLRVEAYEEKGDTPTLRPADYGLRGWTLLFSLLPMAFMALGSLFYHLFSDSSLPVLACVFFSVASSLFLRLFLLGATRRLSRRYRPGIEEESPLRRREIYTRFHAYLRAAFLSPAQALGRLALVGAALTLLFLADWLLALVLSIGMAIVALIQVLFSDKLEKMGEEVGDIERKYLEQEHPKEEREKLLDALWRKTDRYSYLKIGMNLVVLLVTGISVYAYWKLAGGPSAKDLCAASILVYALLSEIESLGSMGNLLKEKAKEEAYFMMNIASRINPDKTDA